MESVLGWLGEVARWVMNLVPHLQVVSVDELAVKLVRGTRVVPLGPGLHWYWPVVTDWRDCTAVRTVLATDDQHLVTQDGRVVALSALVAFSVVDQVAYLVDNQDADDNIEDLTMAAVRLVVARHSYQDLIEQGRQLDEKLATRVRRDVKDFGVAVETVRLTGIAPARVIYLLN